MVQRLIAAALCSVVVGFSAPAVADDIQGVATYYPGDPGWRVNFANGALGCDSMEFSNAVFGKPGTVTVDGVTSNFTMWGGGSGYGNDLSMNFGNVAYGHLTALTLQGTSSIDCGSHRLLLPGYSIAPPTPVPTMTEWAMIMLGALMAGGAALMIHRRWTA